MIEGKDERGNPNTIYDLSSVLFHSLEGGASYDRFIRDAEEAGDQELADYFRQVRDEDCDRAKEARRLLAERTPTAASEAVSGFPTERDALMRSAVEESPLRAVERETAIISQTSGEDIAPLGEVPDVRRMGKASAAEEEIKPDEDKRLVDKARDYLRGEGRER